MKPKQTLIKIIFICSLIITPLMATTETKQAIMLDKLVNTCASCHGPQGRSTIVSNPNLAGQSEKYLIDQLQAFKKGPAGGRNNPIMQSMAAPLTEDQMKALASYFSDQKVNIGTTAENYLKLGRLIYQGGIREKHIPACAACHGPAGSGNPSTVFPMLSGQHAEYVIAQLQAYQNGSRRNDVNGMMTTIAKRLDKEQIEAVANYIQGLH